MKIFSVTLGNKNFELIGIADVVRKTTYFQALVNDVPFAQDKDYEIARAKLQDAIMINMPEKHEGVC
jgi:hypothetical protein